MSICVITVIHKKVLSDQKKDLKVAESPIDEMILKQWFILSIL